MIPVYKPYLPKHAMSFAHDVIDSGWLTIGKYNQMVNDFLQEYLGVKHCFLVGNGTLATHLVSKGLSFKFPTITNLIVPENVYVAAHNCFLFDKKLKLHVIDSDLQTWNYDYSCLDTTAKNLENFAVLAVHNLGNAVDIQKLKNTYGVPVVEDACESFFGKYNGKFCATDSLVSSLSFFGNKNVTSGEGGAVLTNDTDLYNYLKKLSCQGQTRHRYIHDELAYNYRMTDVCAALLYGQLKCIDEIKERKEIVWERYKKAFKNRKDILIQKEEDGCESSKWMFGICFPNSFGYSKKESFFNSRGIEIRPMFYPMITHAHLNDNELVDLVSEKQEAGSNAKFLSKTVIMLPSYPELTEEEQNYIINCVYEFAEEK